MSISSKLVNYSNRQYPTIKGSEPQWFNTEFQNIRNAINSIEALLATEFPTTTIVNDLAVWANTSGTQLADMSWATATSKLSLFTSSLQGVVPGSGGGTTNFLRADGSWATPAGGGNVVGPASSTTNDLAVFNNATGTLLADMSWTTATSKLNLFTTSLQGLVPGSGGGTSNFLRADGSWATPAGAGNVTGPGSSTINDIAVFSNAGGTAIADMSWTTATSKLNIFTSLLQGVVPASGGGTTAFLRADATFDVPPTFTSTTAGYAPASGGGTSLFLRADGSWATPAGGGNVSGPGASTNQDLAVWNGATGTVLADMSWATAVTKLPLGYVTPQMFGAAGDGTTDDTTALSSALNSGKPVLLVGRFKITSAITVNLSSSVSPTALSVMGASGSGVASAIVFANAAAKITVNYSTPASNTGNYDTGSMMSTLRDFVNVCTVTGIGSVATLDPTAGTITSGSFNGLWNFVTTQPGGSGLIGTTTQTMLVNNVGVQSDGTGWCYCGFYLQDMRGIIFNNCAIPSGLGGPLNATQGMGIVFRSTNNGAAGNAPDQFLFDKVTIVGGQIGICGVPSGATTFVQPNDYEGVTIVNSTIIGQQNSIQCCGSDGTVNGIIISNNNIQASGCGCYLYGVGGPIVTNNIVVITTTNTYSVFHRISNNGFGNYGVIMGNTTFIGVGGITALGCSSNGSHVTVTNNVTQ